MPTMYEAATANYREVEKALTQTERAVAAAIRKNDQSATEALCRVQMLLVSVKAEARLTKIAYTPAGLTRDERLAVLGKDNALERWKLAVDTAFRRHYKVADRYTLADKLDHDVLAKHNTMHDVIENEVKLIISLRNKLAHGQWVLPFNSGLSAVEPITARALAQEDTLTLRYRDRLISQLGNIVVDVVVSAPSFEARFNEYFVKIREYRKKLASADYQAWVQSLHQTKVALGRIAPMALESFD